MTDLQITEFVNNNNYTLDQKFIILKNEWIKKYGLYSINQKYNNHCYNTILLLDNVLPLMINDMRTYKHKWFNAVFKLTGIWSVPKEIKEIKEVMDYLVYWYDTIYIKS